MNNRIHTLDHPVSDEEKLASCALFIGEGDSLSCRDTLPDLDSVATTGDGRRVTIKQSTWNQQVRLWLEGLGADGRSRFYNALPDTCKRVTRYAGTEPRGKLSEVFYHGYFACCS